ncbi:MAG: branched-chain amino acid ABC transporter permease [Streptosporangiales bacterium]|nr:branched-chain amino acid ABC transporter permease [Streptosporangiales bacterium]
MGLALQLVTNGLALGALLAVVALGLALVFGVMGVVNFVHAEFITLGGYVTYFFVAKAGGPALVGVVLAIVVGIALGFATQRLVLSRVADRPPLDGLLLTYGLSVVGLGLITFAFSGDYRSYPEVLSGGIHVAGVTVATEDLLVVALCVLLVAAVTAFLRFTRTGSAMRAVAQHRDAAAACGIDLRRMDAVAFGLGGGLGAAAGSVLSMSFVTTPELGRQWLLIGFVIVVLGGLGSLVGAIGGGVVVGLVQVGVGYALDDTWARLVVYALLFVLLFVRPQGLAGGRTT